METEKPRSPSPVNSPTMGFHGPGVGGGEDPPTGAAVVGTIGATGGVAVAGTVVGTLIGAKIGEAVGAAIGANIGAFVGAGDGGFVGMEGRLVPVGVFVGLEGERIVGEPDPIMGERVGLKEEGCWRKQRCG
jgi:hypothetical protein